MSYIWLVRSGFSTLDRCPPNFSLIWSWTSDFDFGWKMYCSKIVLIQWIISLTIKIKKTTPDFVWQIINHRLHHQELIFLQFITNMFWSSSIRLVSVGSVRTNRKWRWKWARPPTSVCRFNNQTLPYITATHTTHNIKNTLEYLPVYFYTSSAMFLDFSLILRDIGDIEVRLPLRIHL